MKIRAPLAPLSLALLAPFASAQEDTAGASLADAIDWDVRAAEHLLNRAGFGAPPREIHRWVEDGPEALVDWLFAERPEEVPFYSEPVYPDRGELAEMSDEDRRRMIGRLRSENRRQVQAYLGWWVERMIEGEDPLRERMTLFWHGLLTSSIDTVRRSHSMIRQNQFLRENALGNYGDLLGGILRDPAMLVYLDNNTNRRGSPNENLAREVMELFSLGEGNYTERDVQEAARALTGHSVDRAGEYRFLVREHDFGRKTILGRTGRHGPDELTEILLDQEACGAYVAGRLLAYMEGVEPRPERRAEYASFLRESEYEVAPFLRKLFLDPRFYREEIVGAKIQAPVEHLVGTCRRLGIAPHPGFLVAGAGLTGQELFRPPSVKGWEEGPAWISTSALLLRGNFAGILLGVVHPEDFSAGEEEPIDGDIAAVDIDDLMDEDEMAMDDLMMEDTSDVEMMTEDDEPGARRRDRDVLVRILQLMDRVGYQPRIHLRARLARRGISSDGEIVDALLDTLLAIEAPTETRALLVDWLSTERAALDIEEGELLGARREAESLLRQLAHLILSLPEAQLG